MSKQEPLDVIEDVIDFSVREAGLGHEAKLFAQEAVTALAQDVVDAKRYRAIRDALVRQDQRAADVIDNGIEGFKDAEVLTSAMLDEIADRIIVACAE